MKDVFAVIFMIGGVVVIACSVVGVFCFVYGIVRCSKLIDLLNCTDKDGAAMLITTFICGFVSAVVSLIGLQA